MLCQFKFVKKIPIARMIWNRKVHDLRPETAIGLRHYAASPVFVIAKKNSLTSSDDYEKSAFLMAEILRRRRRQSHCNFNTIKYATELLDRCDMLDETNARMLIASCGKSMSFFENLKSRQAQQIFKLAKSKSISLANELLKVQHENDMHSDPQQVLSRLDKLKLVPNETTFLQLIACACVGGNIHAAKQILSLCYQYELQIPMQIYGYFAYSLGKAGETESAMRLVDQLLKHHEKLSWGFFSLFLRGMVNNNVSLEDILDKYDVCLRQDMLINQFLDICKEFWRHDKNLDVALLYKYLPFVVRLDELVHATHHLLKYPSHFSAPCLKYLMSKSNGNLHLNAVIRMLNILMKECSQKDNLEELWSTYLLLKKFSSNGNAVEFLMLSILVEEDFCTKEFFEKLSETGVELESSIPSQIKQALKKRGLDSTGVETFLEQLPSCKVNNNAADFQTAILS